MAIGGLCMAKYEKSFTPYYTNGWENQPSENTPIMAESLDAYDATLEKIEDFLANMEESGGGDAPSVEVPTKVSQLENDAGYITLEDIGDIEFDNLVLNTRTVAGIDLADDITAEELVESTRAVSGEVHVDFAEAEQTNPALFEFMPYPIGADGKKSVGQSGQIYVSNGDGTFSWMTLGVAEGGAY